jgi:hypothetical protein
LSRHRFSAWYRRRFRQANRWTRPRPLPAYKEPAEPRFPQREEELFLALDPEDLMSPSEAKEAGRLLRRLDKAHRSMGEDTEDLRSCRITLQSRIAVLARAILHRHIGLQRHMVVDVERDGGYRVVLQVLEMSLHQRTGPSDWMWSLEGRALRKDKTLGSLRAGISFTRARIARRKLTGEWLRLAQLPRRFKEHEHRAR